MMGSIPTGQKIAQLKWFTYLLTIRKFFDPTNNKTFGLFCDEISDIYVQLSVKPLSPILSDSAKE